MPAAEGGLPYTLAQSATDPGQIHPLASTFDVDQGAWSASGAGHAFRVASTNTLANAYHMIHIEPGVYVRIEELPGRPHPLPLQSGFSMSRAYRVIGVHSPSETSECYFILSNDRNEVWFISNRHCRTVAVAADRHDFNFELPGVRGNELRANAA